MINRAYLMIKMNIIIVLFFKTQLNGQFRARPESGWPLTRVNLRIKVVIIIVLKSNSGVNLGKAPIVGQVDHWYYYSFKIRLRGWPETSLKSQIGLTID
jgi:hypothetical protein